MTYDEYWKQDVWLASDYRKAWELKQKAENDKAWLNGLYNYKAFSVVLYNAFRKKGSKAENYFEKPIDFDAEKEEPNVQEIRQSVYDQLKALKERWDGRREH